MAESGTGFIAIFSSAEASDEAWRVQDAFEARGFVAKHWLELPGTTIRRSVTEELREASAAVVILTPDTRYDPEGRIVAGNILFELGLAVAMLGVDRTFLLRPAGANLELPSDLGDFKWKTYKPGETPDDLKRALGARCREIADELVKLSEPTSKAMAWETYFDGIERIANEKVRKSRGLGGFQPHAVIAVNPGGAIVGGVLYFRTGRKAFRFAGLFPRAQSHDMMTATTTALIETVALEPHEKTLRVLVVDASIKSGESMTRALAAMANALPEGAECEIAALVDCPDLRDERYPVKADYVALPYHDEFPYGSV